MILCGIVLSINTAAFAFNIGKPVNIFSIGFLTSIGFYFYLFSMAVLRRAPADRSTAGPDRPSPARLGATRPGPARVVVVVLLLIIVVVVVLILVIVIIILVMVVL